MSKYNINYSSVKDIFIKKQKTYISLKFEYLRFICETRIPKAKRIEIRKSNNPAKGGGLNTPAACCENKFPKLALGFHTRDRMLSLEGIILLIYLNKQVVLFFYNIG